MADSGTWTVASALAWTVERLSAHDGQQSRLVAERLLSLATGLSRVQLYTNHDRLLSEGERVGFLQAVERRLAGEPLQYIVGEVPFRHIVVKVQEGVFIPRPETEMLVEVALEWLRQAGGGGAARAAAPRLPRVLDLCTGSGAVGLSLAREAPEPGCAVIAVDISPQACACAADNAQRLGLADRVEIREGDLLEAVRGAERFEIIVANPPYVASEALDGLAAEVREHEPRVALDGGENGLRVVRRIIGQAPAHLEAGGLLALEVDPGQAVIAAKLAADSGLEGVEVIEDLTGRPRILRGHSAAA